MTRRTKNLAMLAIIAAAVGVVVYTILVAVGKLVELMGG